MLKLIRIEWLKMRKYSAFWWIMSLTALAYPGISLVFYEIYSNVVNESNQAGQLAKMALGNPFTFPEVWHTLGYCLSGFVFIPAVLVIMFVSNEYTSRTHRQNIIDGWSRSEFITSKIMDVLILTFIVTLMYAISALVTGIINQDRLIQDTWSLFYYVGLFALQTFAQLTIAFLCGYLIKKSFLSLGVFLFYFLVFENIAERVLWKFVNDIGRFLPIEVSDRMIPKPAFFRRINPEAYQASIHAIPTHIVLTIIYTVAWWGLIYYVHKRRDLN